MAKDKCFKKKYDECNRKYQPDSCGSNVGANYVGWAACQESLLDKIEKCDEEIASEYQPCKEAEAESLRRKEQYQSQPSEPAPAEPTSNQQTPPTSSKDGFIFIEPVLDSVSVFVTFTFFGSDIKRNQQPIPPRLSQDSADNLFNTDSWQKLQTDQTFKVTEPTTFSNGDKKTFLELRPGKSNQVALIHLEEGSNLLYLEDGEIEVIKKNPGVLDGGYDGIKTPNGTVISVQTHYLVSYDKKVNQTIVAVYEGEVEVKTKDGKTVTVSPDGDNPGVIVVSQKLSPLKFGLAGVILAVTVSAGFLVWKRKFKYFLVV